ncbi:hypothetical protein [Wenjunlia tyrosinilytica]|jgi:hypothetical protein|uniref:Uncharacterized protein n=1 Tax=Wenjunlia tyrosinilytica TaxID=1544741 RepID=A0A917ZNX3_9ACTN|nr:hypothetical protein [Wenjunlia tyrosinilytica]GGO86715.1 hypothetical protein GCM10012280_23450 [Wenjunlia tyrosinilytica]
MSTPTPETTGSGEPTVTPQPTPDNWHPGDVKPVAPVVEPDNWHPGDIKPIIKPDNWHPGEIKPDSTDANPA